MLILISICPQLCRLNTETYRNKVGPCLRLGSLEVEPQPVNGQGLTCHLVTCAHDVLRALSQEKPVRVQGKQNRAGPQPDPTGSLGV